MMLLTKRYFCDVSKVNNVPRLARVIASTGIFSRRQAEKIILDGRVKVNYQITTTVTKEIYSNDKILIDDVELNLGYQVDRPKLWMANKLRGEIVAHEDPVLKRPVMYARFKEYMDDTRYLKAINKLEINSEGLQLLTNSPLLALILDNTNQNAPQFPRKYRIRVHGKLTPSKLDGLSRGLHVNGVKYRPIVPKFERTTGVISWLTITCTENKSRFLRNCFEHLFLQLTRVIATQFGPYKLPNDLTPGSIREIQMTPEIETLYLKEITKRMPKTPPPPPKNKHHDGNNKKLNSGKINNIGVDLDGNMKSNSDDSSSDSSSDDDDDSSDDDNDTGNTQELEYEKKGESEPESESDFGSEKEEEEQQQTGEVNR